MRGILILFTVAGALAFATGAQAITPSSVSLAWNPSPSSNVAGYRVYYGTSSGNYITFVPVSNVTNVTINGLTSGTTYYFAATSYDSSGNESGFSPEISATVGELATSATLTTMTAAKGQYAFAVSGASGYQYVVQASTNLVNWISLQTNKAPFNFVDSNASQFSRRFYRTAYISNQ